MRTPLLRDKVFVSYSHKDRIWLDRLKPFLGLLELEGRLSVWVDTEIPVGFRWEGEIKTALESAYEAILMISADFCASKYVMSVEIPYLIKAAERGEVRLFPILVRPVPRTTKLEALQFINPGRKSLAELSLVKRELVLSRLAETLAESLPSKQPSSPLVGPVVPCFVSSAFPAVDYGIYGRKELLRNLNKIWTSRLPSILTIVAMGGTGKTALVNRWLQDQGRNGWRGADRVFIWSFYSQGCDEGKQVSSEPFLLEAFRFFGLPDPGHRSAWEKGRLLAERIRQERTLLVLDGLESLQEPTGTDSKAGHLRDQAVLSLLLGLATGQPGLAIVTTRLPLSDLDVIPPERCPTIELERLHDAAGAELLRNLLAPTEAPAWQRELVAKTPETELQRASREFGGHALALRLLANYLASAHGGDIRCRRQVVPLSGAERETTHARHMLHQYSAWFAGKPELDLLNLLGLFDRPASAGAIAALRSPPAIAGLTERLQAMDLTSWNTSLSHLRKPGLVTQESDGALDCHPLVREYFGDRLKHEKSETWKAAHSRLFQYFCKQPTNVLPQSWEELDPLFQAVAHGCKAERFAESKTLYETRIVGCDDNGTLRYQPSFAFRRFGASNLYLSALYHFFKTPWTQPYSSLSLPDMAFVLQEAGHYLFLLGRLKEAIRPLEMAMDIHESLKKWTQASTSARLVREVCLYLGRLEEARKYAVRGIQLADKGKKPFGRMGLRAAMAQVLFYMGRLDEAEQWFAEAEWIHKQSAPRSPTLGYTWGFWYCELLLDRVEKLMSESPAQLAPSVKRKAMNTLKDVNRRARGAMALANDRKSVFERAHAHQTFGHAFLLKALLEGRCNFRLALHHLDHAVEGLRQSGQQHHLASALLARASLRRSQQNFLSADSDLKDAMEIAERADMVIHKIDLNLEYARLRRDQNNRVDAAAFLRKAKAMIEETGYHRRYEPAFPDSTP